MDQTNDSTERWSRGHWMQTFSGLAFYPLGPSVDDVVAMDIGHSLAMQCRYNGHVQRFYSVAEHCVLMSDWILEELTGIADDERRHLALWALLHDAAEAYVGDMVRPLKLHMPDFCKVDDAVTAIISRRFGARGETVPPEVKSVDTRILLDERAALLSVPPGDWALGDIRPLGVAIRGWAPSVAKWEYLSRLEALTGEALS